MSTIEEDDRLKIEEVLRKSEERFRQVVESAPSAMVMIGPAGQIVMVNAQSEKLFGYARDEMLGQPIEILVPERFRAKHPGLRTAFFSRPLARPMGEGRDLYGLKKDASEFPIEIGLNPIETDEGTMVLSAIVDISGRKRMEERFRQVVESAPSAMVMIGASGNIAMVNAQSEQLFGYGVTRCSASRLRSWCPSVSGPITPGCGWPFLRDRSRGQWAPAAISMA